MKPTVEQKRAIFRTLHEQGCFILPNPWDAGGARMLQGMGFKAIATTSAGHAWSMGLPDAAVRRDVLLDHLRAMVDATDIPVNADFEDGFGETPQEVAESVRMAIDTGVAGLSVEDSTGDAANPLRSIDDAVARMRAARAAIDASGKDVLLVGRAENFFVGRPDIDDAIARLRAYADAGADCLYAPSIKTPEQIRAVVAAVAPKPVNFLIGSTSDYTLKDIEALGVRRISIGGALSRAAWGGFMNAARSLAEGRFDFEGATPGGELNGFFQSFDKKA